MADASTRQTDLKWPRTPAGVFWTALAASLWALIFAMKLGILPNKQSVLALYPFVGLAAGSFCWRSLYRQRRANLPDLDFQGKLYREMQMLCIWFAFLTWCLPYVYREMKPGVDLLVIFTSLAGWVALSRLVVRKWPAKP